MRHERTQVTELLSAVGRGDAAAAERLWHAVYDELRRVAKRRMAREARGSDLQTTVLVQEAYLRLMGRAGGSGNAGAGGAANDDTGAGSARVNEPGAGVAENEGKGDAANERTGTAGLGATEPGVGGAATRDKGAGAGAKGDASCDSGGGCAADGDGAGGDGLGVERGAGATGTAAEVDGGVDVPAGCEAEVEHTDRVGGGGGFPTSRAHFFAAAANAMRQFLVDDARRRGALKRGGGRPAVSLTEPVASLDEDPAELLALDEALKELAARDARKARVVELRYFTGLTIDETAEVIGASPRTIDKDWRFAKAWLHRALA